MRYPLQVRLALLYGALLVLAGVGFSPVGFDRYTIWVQLKVVGWSLSFVPLLLLVSSVLRERAARQRLSWPTTLPMWAAAVLAAVIVARGLLSPTSTGWLGYFSLPEGALFHLSLCAAFVLVAWLGSHIPALRRVVVASVVLVAVVASLLAIPQTFDWRIDYVYPGGPDVGELNVPTASGVYRGQSPNSVFWHRGHLGIVAAIGLIVACHANLRDRGRGGGLVGAATTFAVVVTALAVVISDTRAPQLAGAIGVAALWVGVYHFGVVRERAPGTASERWRWFLARQVLPVFAGALIGLVLSFATGGGRGMSVVGLVSGQAAASDVLTSTSGRAYPWSLAWTAWLERPLFGHGFFHFHRVMAADLVARAIERGDLDADAVSRMEVRESSVQVQREDGTLWWGRLWGTKPHNFVLEHLVNMGLLGLLAASFFYGSLVVVGLWTKRPIALAVLAAWLVYLWFWYESIQYSPLVWVLLAAVVAGARPDSAGRASVPSGDLRNSTQVMGASTRRDGASE